MQRNRYVIIPQSSCEHVAVYGTVRGTFGCIWWYISKHTSHCSPYYIGIHKATVLSDLVRSIVVCQTDAYPSAKLLPRTADTDGRLFYESRMAYRPTSDASEARLSAIEFKPLISPFKVFSITRSSSFKLRRIVKVERHLNQLKKQYNLKLPT